MLHARKLCVLVSADVRRQSPMLLACLNSLACRPAAGCSWPKQRPNCAVRSCSGLTANATILGLATQSTGAALRQGPRVAEAVADVQERQRSLITGTLHTGHLRQSSSCMPAT
jgi:hypothetical protein